MPIEKIILFTKKGCSYCDLAKMLLKRYKLDYEIKDLSDDDKAASGGRPSTITLP